MELAGDRRGQSIQIGAILLFSALIIAFASYQAFVVPNQNREVEFNHNQGVQSDMQDLRNAIVSVGGSDDARSVTVQLGTRYPSRLAARNPGPPSGSLDTVGTTDDRVDLTIENAQASGETGDFWNESQRYNTGGITYSPNYNVYTNPPDTVYEQSVLYNRFPTGNITVSNQSIIDGTDISLVVLNGSVSRSSTEATSVDVRSVSSSTERVRLENDSTGPINITFASTRSAAYWDFLENTQSTVTSVSNASRGNGFYNVSVELDPDRTYSVQLTKVGVGDGVTGEDAAYLTDVEGDGAAVTQGETTELTLEVRDRFNNPPDDAASLSVKAAVAPGSDGTLQSNSSVPDEDGQVTFVYEATGSTGTQQINVSYVGLGSGFNATTSQNVSMAVDVTSGGSDGGGSAYSVLWENPETDNDKSYLSDCSDSSCTWNVNADDDDTLTLRAGTNPMLEGTFVDFAANNTTVGAISPGDATTGSDGEVTTDLTANVNGTIGVYVASGGSSDVIGLTLENVGVGGSPVGLAIYRDGRNLASVEPDGTTRTYDNTQKPAVIGPSTDLDGDGVVEIPYVTATGGPTRLNVVDADGSGGNKTTLFDKKGNPTPRTDGRMGVGDLDEDGTNAVFLVDTNSNLVKYEDGEGVQTISAISEDVSAVAGVSDFDGDGSPDLIYTNSDQNIKYYDGSTTAGTGVNLNAAKAIGEPSSAIDGDTEVEAAYITSNSNYGYANSSGQDGLIRSDEPKEVPIGVSDWDGDGPDEIVFLDQNGFLKYANATGATSFIRDSSGSRISTGNTGKGVVVGARP
ncbi:hypothetical protein BRC96_04290 [Halobacteriales archaeon QS_6_64_34]|nr:MAG: hypothetical protein BRC96_04290 [Halobacteriales archaeon QS_6_64_34]